MEHLSIEHLESLHRAVLQRLRSLNRMQEKEGERLREAKAAINELIRNKKQIMLPLPDCEDGILHLSQNLRMETNIDANGDKEFVFKWGAKHKIDCNLDGTIGIREISFTWEEE